MTNGEQRGSRGGRQRVLFMPHHFRQPGDKGGLRSWHLVNQLEKLADVDVVVPGVDTLTGERAAGLPRFQPWVEERYSAATRVFRVNALRNDRSSKVRRALYYLSFSLLQFLRAVGLGRVDVVLTTSMPVSTMLLGLLVARLRRAALAVDVRDLPTDLAIELGYFRNNAFSRLMRRMEYFVYRRADLLITVSEGMAGMLVAAGVPAERVHVVPIGYDALELPEGGRSADAVLLGISPDAFVVLYSGTMGYVVDVATILRAAQATRERRDILYLFVGDGQRLGEYQALVAEQGSNCRFVGRVPKSLVGSICARAQVCVYPLIDGKVIATLLGNKIFDYMGAAKPTVYTGPPGDVSALIAASGCGICLEAGDDRGLAGVLLELSGQRERCAALGEAGYRYVMDGLTAPHTTAVAARLILQARD